MTPIRALLCSVVTAVGGTAAAQSPLQPPVKVAPASGDRVVDLTVAPPAGETRLVAGEAEAPSRAVDGVWIAGTSRIPTPLPIGYPPPTAPGRIELKSYPLVRKAEATAEFGPEFGRNLAFFKLFNHIQRNSIAMTSPVEMRLDPAADDAATLAGWSMAFLYREPTMGALGADGSVEVVDDAPLTVLSIGIRGDYSAERAWSEAETLRAQLAKLPGWRAVGSPRALFYNGPEARDDDRWAEVQLVIEREPAPVEPKSPAKKRRRVI